MTVYSVIVIPGAASLGLVRGLSQVGQSFKELPHSIQGAEEAITSLGGGLGNLLCHIHSVRDSRGVVYSCTPRAKTGHNNFVNNHEEKI